MKIGMFISPRYNGRYYICSNTILDIRCTKYSIKEIIEIELYLFFSRGGGNRVSTSSEVEKRRSLSRSNTGGENNPNDTASDEDSQLSYSTTGSPAPNASLHAESSSISNQTKSSSSGKVLCRYQ